MAGKKSAINRDLLSLIVAATQNNSYHLVTKEEGEPLLTNKPALIIINPDIAEGDKRAARATDDGIKLIMSEPQKPVAAVTGAAPASPFAIVKGVVLPPSKRGVGLHSGAPKQYPFDVMEIGDSFFVPVSEKHPNPVKTLGSTVSGANMRFAEKTGEMKTVKRAVRGEDRKAKTDPAGNKIVEEVSLPKYKLTRKFEIREVKSGQMYGTYTAPGDGALIMRVELPE